MKGQVVAKYHLEEIQSQICPGKLLMQLSLAMHLVITSQIGSWLKGCVCVYLICEFTTLGSLIIYACVLRVVIKKTALEHCRTCSGSAVWLVDWDIGGE